MKGCSGLFLAVLLLPMASTEVCGQGAPQLPGPRVMVRNLYEENDVFAQTDRHYTQGLKYSVLRDELGSSERTERIAKRLWSAFGNSSVPEMFNAGWSLGQNMYTPEDIQQVALARDDRPWAGWLYGGALLQVASDCNADENPDLLT